LSRAHSHYLHPTIKFKKDKMNNSKEKNEHTMGRRAFVGGILPVIAAASVPTWAAKPAPEGAAGGQGSFPGLITREKKPLNLEFPFPTLQERITPNNLFFVRSHFNIPKIDAASWHLIIGGEVNQEITLTYAEIRKLPSKTVMATIECAGNGRANLAPKVKGLSWEQGGIGNANWTGVPLSVLLDKAGIKAGTVEIILEGEDQGEVTDEPKSPGTIKFARSMPLAHARQAEVIIAYQMNGKDLSAEHGFPVRAIIPGWYGMASVKWLTKITATAIPFDGYWQTLEYAYWKRKDGLPTLTPVTTLQVKAEISRPVLHELITAGTTYRVFGAAWVGENNLSKVEVSTDEGKTWQAGKLLDKAVQNAWQLWEYNWAVPKTPGRYKLMARATDQKGNMQPDHHDPDRRNYMVNFMTPIEVEVQ